jgi:hypothetical protein
VEKVEAALCAAGQTDNKVQAEQTGDKDFTIAANFGEFVAERRDDGFRAAKLEEK